MRFRNVCITIFNYSITDFQSIVSSCGIFSYAVYQEEISPTTNKRHIQFYGELNGQYSLSAIKKSLDNKTIHVDKRNGTQKQAITYCSKELSRAPGCEPIIYGEKKTPGKRTDIQLIREEVKKGTKLTELLDMVETPNFQTIRCAQLLSSIYLPKRKTKPTVLWFYGSTGIGKTKLVYDTFKDVYSTLENSKWFDGYEQNKVILVDDYRPDWMKFHTLLKFLDRYEFKREIKGSTLQINSPFIIFTSPKPPTSYWGNRTTEDTNQLFRRIDAIINCDLLAQIRSKSELY